MSAGSAAFREASDAYARDDLDAAERGFRRLLETAPEHAASLNALAAIACRRGRMEEGLALFRRAVALAPGEAAYHANLGRALGEAGRFAEAAEMQARAAALDPMDAATRLGLGAALYRLGRLDEAEAAYRAALALRPGAAAGWNDLGRVLAAAGRVEEAETALRRAVALRPDYAQAHVNLAAVLMETGRPAEAAASCRAALAAAPDHAAAHSNLGNALRKLGALEEAEAACRRAIALDPDLAEAHSNLGVVLHDRARLDDSVAAYRRAIALRPDFAQAHCQLGIGLLLQGKFEEGAVEYDWHLELRPPAIVTAGRPRWEGQAVPGQTILLHAGQGLGDAIQFVRYAPAIRARCGRTVLVCRRPLVRLLASAPGVDAVVCDDEPVPDFDCHAPLMGLLRSMGTRLETIPGGVPYLAADPLLAARRFADLPAGREPLVGLVWAGNPRHKNDRNRSISLDLLAPLLDVPGVRFVSLQVGERASDMARPAPGAMLDLSPRLEDFAATAAAVSRLDLVISVDTAMAHLAGALAKPVWVMLPFVPDWRWLWQRPDSPWYPTMRLFRQAARGAWMPVVAELCAALRAFAEGRRAAAPGQPGPARDYARG